MFGQSILTRRTPLRRVALFCGKGDDMLEQGRAEHNSRDVYYRSVVGAAEAGSEIRLGIRIRSGKSLCRVLLRLWQGTEGERILPLVTEAASHEEERYYFADLRLPDRGCLVWYYFILETSEGTCYYGNNREQLGGVV